MKKTRLLLLILSLLLIFVSCQGKENEIIDENSSDTKASETRIVPETEIKEVEVKNVSFVGMGDNIVYLGTVNDAKKNAVSGGRTYNFKPIYSDVAELVEGSDIAFINQETLMCGDGIAFDWYPTFNGPQDMGYDLEELGFDVVAMANNHMADKGGEGLEKTIAFWKSRSVLMVGGYNSEEDFNTPRIIERNGIKIAFLAYTYGTNGMSVSSKYNVYIPYLENANIEKDVANAKNDADMVFVSVHWGTEYHHVPSDFKFSENDEQRTYAKRFADAGVDVILGHHPHVIEPVEWITGKDGNKTLCMYSLGNFMAEQAEDYNMIGGIIKFDIVKVGDEKPVVENPTFIPTVFDFNRQWCNNHVYYLEDYTPEQAANHGVNLCYGKKANYDKFIKYVTSTIPEAFLPESFVKKVSG